MLADVADQSPSRGGKPLTVICVEDNADVLQLIKFAIDGEDALDCTHAFKDGCELLQLIESGAQPPDVVVTDWSMPGMGGHDVARAVRAGWPTVRVIVYTAYSHQAVIDDACEAGVWGIVSKGHTFDVLISAIQNADDGRMIVRC